jgi:SNF2 family DNA or RNA helicase
MMSPRAQVLACRPEKGLRRQRPSDCGKDSADTPVAITSSRGALGVHSKLAGSLLATSAHDLFQEEVIRIAGIVPKAFKLTKKEPKSREECLKFVKKMYKDGNIWSARVKEVYDIVQHLQKTKLGEKIVIFSKYLKFLDLLSEVFSHMDGRTSVYRFDGQQKPVRRDITRFMFSTADEHDMCFDTSR